MRRQTLGTLWSNLASALALVCAHDAGYHHGTPYGARADESCNDLLAYAADMREVEVDALFFVDLQRDFRRRLRETESPSSLSESSSGPVESTKDKAP